MITFNGKEFETRTFNVMLEGNLTTITIAGEDLLEEISIDGKHFKSGTDEQQIDESIYFYVEVGKLKLLPTDICEKCLDMPMEFEEEMF